MGAPRSSVRWTRLGALWPWCPTIYPTLLRRGHGRDGVPRGGTSRSPHSAAATATSSRPPTAPLALLTPGVNGAWGERVRDGAGLRAGGASGQVTGSVDS